MNRRSTENFQGSEIILCDTTMMDMGHGYICPNPQNVQIPKINPNVNGCSSAVNKRTTLGEAVLVREVTCVGAERGCKETLCTLNLVVSLNLLKYSTALLFQKYTSTFKNCIHKNI